MTPTCKTGACLCVAASFLVLGGLARAQGSSLIEELIVTAEKREQTIEETPIAVSAFDGDALEASNIDGARDIQFEVPNTLFSRTNFGTNFVIRGIGNNALSSSADSGTGVHFSGAYQTSSFLFETDFYDVERVEVLRGPQGTLYGRNTTAGVINVIPNKPEDRTGSNASLLGGDFGERRWTAAVNLPIVPSLLQVRGAVYAQRRDGTTYNSYTDNYIDGRDIAASRLSARIGGDEGGAFELVYFRDHFREEDTKMRISKQLCHRDPTQGQGAGQTTALNLGCLPNRSLYGEATLVTGRDSSTGNPIVATTNPYGTPTSHSLASGFALGVLPSPPGSTPQGPQLVPFGTDAYAGANNPADLRGVNAAFDPYYFVETDFEHTELRWNWGPSMTFTAIMHSGTSDNRATSDYHLTAPSATFGLAAMGAANFTTGTQLGHVTGISIGAEDCLVDDNGDPSNLGPGCVLLTNDPTSPQGRQMVDNNRANFALAWEELRARTEFEVTEVRLVTDFSGWFNFSLGAFMLEHTSSGAAELHGTGLALANALAPGGWEPGQTAADSANAIAMGGTAANPAAYGCPLVDIFVDDSHSCSALGFFRSHVDQYQLTSEASYLELYLGSGALRLTLGMRNTSETKTVRDRQTQLNDPRLPYIEGVSGRPFLPGTANTLHWGLDENGNGVRMYPWRQPVLDGTAPTNFFSASVPLTGDPIPLTLANTGQTLQEGYSAFVPANRNPLNSEQAFVSFANSAIPTVGVRSGSWDEPSTKFGLDFYLSRRAMFYVMQTTGYKSGGLNPPSATGLFPQTYDPERVTSTEFGFKFGGKRARLHLSLFQYDYEGLQLSKIVDLTAINENVDAEMSGAELDFQWSPSDRWLFSLRASALDTEITGGSSVDPADPAQYHRDSSFATGQGGTEVPRFVNIKNPGTRDIYLQANPDPSAGGYTFNPDDCGTAMQGGVLECIDIYLVNPAELYYQQEKYADTSELSNALGAWLRAVTPNGARRSYDFRSNTHYRRTGSYDTAGYFIGSRISSERTADDGRVTALALYRSSSTTGDPTPRERILLVDYANVFRLPTGELVPDNDPFAAGILPHGSWEEADTLRRGFLTTEDLAQYETFRYQDANGAWQLTSRPIYSRDALGRYILKPESEHPSAETLASLTTRVPVGIAVDLTGKRIPNAPERTISFSTAYSFDFGGPRARLKLDYYWQSDFHARAYNTRGDLVRQWQVWNGSFAVTDTGGTWEMEFWVKNMADKDHITGVYVGDAASGNFSNVFLLQPRTFGLALRLNY